MPSPQEFKFDNYTTKVTPLTRDSHIVDRFQFNDEPQSSFDVFPVSWFIFRSNMPEGSVKVLTNTGEHSFAPGSALFLPPLHLIHWKLSAGPIEWSALRCELPLPPELQQNAFSFTPSFGNEFPKLSLVDLLLQHQKLGTALVSELNQSKIAKLFKNQIDLHFDTDVSLANLSQSIESDLSKASHAFKACYRVTPVDYLLRLRMNQAIRKISFENRNLTEACYESGFEDYSSFFRHIKSWLNVPPSHLLYDKPLQDLEVGG